MANHQDNYTSNFEGQDPAGDAGLSLFLNGAEYSYRPSGSDTTVYIPIVEKFEHDYGNIVYAITRVLAAGGSPIVTKLGAEFTYTSGDADTYKFVNVSGDNITEMTIDRNTGTVTTQNNFLRQSVEVEYGVDAASDVASIISKNGLPYVRTGDIVANLYKIEVNKYTFRTTHLRVDDDINYLDIVDYIVNGAAWTTVTKTVSGGSSGQSYIATVKSLADFDTTGYSGMHSVLSVDDVPADGIYQLSVMLHITPKTASATKSDLVLQFTSSDNTGWPSHTFHAVVDDSQTFAQQLSFSTSVSLKAGENTLRIQCGDLNTEYLVYVDELTTAGLVVGGPQPAPVVTSGANIYPTLQDAASDAANLSVGDIFETNGFHTNGDGGAARYLVSNTGTANGMDIVQLSAGKVAVFQWGMVTRPEQLGAYGDGTHDDTSIFEQIVTYYSSATDMQTKRIIQGSFEKKYLISNLFVHDVQIRQCSLKGTGLTTGIGIKLGSRAVIDTCILSEFINAIYTDDTDNAVHSIVKGCTISWCGNGIYLASGRDTMGASVDGIRIDNCYISNLGTLGHSSYSTPPSWDSTGCAIWLYGNFKNVVITNNVLEYNGYTGLRLECRNNQYEPSVTVIGNYFEGNKFSAIWMFLQKRPCAVEITGNQLTKIFDNVHVTTAIFATSGMSPYPIETPYGKFIGVATTNSGNTYLNVNTNNLYSSILTVYPSDLTANTLAITPAKVANSKSPVKVLSIKGRGDASITMTITYIDSSNTSHSTSIVADALGMFDVIIPMESINLYDSLLDDITIEITSSVWTFLTITEISVT